MLWSGLIGFWGAPQSVAQAQTEGLVVRYNGVLRLSGVGAPAGVKITAISARNATDTTVCGTAVTRDNLGSFTLDIAAIPIDCVARTQQGPHPTYIFLVNGENVGVHSSAPLSLNRPDGLGRARSINLSGVMVNGLPLDTFDTATLMVTRYYGSLRLSGVLAPAGVPITAESDVDGVICGSGVTSDDVGSFYLDIAPIPGSCVAQLAAGPHPRYIFRVGEENVGVHASAPLAFTRPEGLANPRSINLRGLQPPPAPAPTPAP